MTPAETYELLRTLTSPVVAITSRRGDTRNGMISDGAARASIVPDIPRLIVFIHKFNYSHDLIFETGKFGLHILHTGQLDLVHRLGWFSGRDQDKLAGVPHHTERTGVPILDDSYGWFDCEVVNAMDTGSSTCFLGEAVAGGRGPGADMLYPNYLRDHLPAELAAEYPARLKHAQDRSRALARDFTPVWRAGRT